MREGAVGGEVGRRLASDIGGGWILDLWEIVPTPAEAVRVREVTIAKHLVERKVRTLKAKAALEILRQTPLTVAPGSTEAAVAHIETIIPRLRLLNELHKKAAKNLDELTSGLEPEKKHEQRDATILLSLPGIGRIVVATMLAEAAQPLGARDYQQLRSQAGAAPVTRASGKRSGRNATVVMRQACSTRLRNALFFWAQNAIRYDDKSKALYSAHRKRGHTHPRALRSVADRLLAMACAMLRNGTIYDPSRRLVAESSS
jgi:transposase